MKSSKKNLSTISLILTLILISNDHIVAQTKSHRLTVKLEEAPFDDLSLLEYSEDRRIRFEGAKITDDVWEFDIPDSIVSTSNRMRFSTAKYDSINNTITSVRFSATEAGDPMYMGNIGIDDERTFIYAKFKEKSVNHDQYIEVRTKDNNDSLVIGKIILYDFALLPQNDDNADIMVRMHAKEFSSFYGEDRSYEEDLALYASIANKYPDSRFLMTTLANSLNDYRSTNDIKMIYDHLSSKHKESYWAKHIERFLQGKFENDYLPAIYTNVEEKIIKNPSRYHLIVFTASWCVPCVEEIPLLKTIHKDLGSQLDITYITIDREKDIPNFERVLEEHQITWPSFLAFKNLTEVRQKFFVNSIPHCVLVSPDAEMTILDVRKEEDLQQLYSKFKT